MWEFHATTATEFYRIFDTGWEGLPKVKHLLRPDITYDYIPDIDQRQVPNYDIQLPKTNTVTYGLTQRLIGKLVDPTTGQSRYHQYAYLRVSQIVNLFEVNRHLTGPTDSRQPFGDVTVDLKLFSTKYFRVENNTAYDPNKNKVRNTYTVATLTDPRGDSLSLEHRLDTGVSEQVNGGVRIKVSPSFAATYAMRYSRFDQKPLTKIYGVDYQKQCWGVNVTYSETPAVAGNPAEKKILVMFNLLGLGSFGTK